MDKELLRQIDQIDELLPNLSQGLLADDVLICECFCVSALDIREACRDQQKVDVQKLSDELSLGHGCQTCLKRIDSWVNNIF